MSAIIPSISLNDDDSFDMYQILLKAKNDVIMRWDDGVTFKGRIKPIKREDSVIVFRTLDGQITGRTSGPKKISISLEKGNIICTQEDNDDNQLLSKETLYVRDDGTLSEMDYWNINKIYENCYFAKWTYRNGNYFEGSIKSIVTTDRISSTATKGIFKYSNGDRFEGDVSTKTVGPFFVDGTTIFLDGTDLKGNWLENYKLTKSQLEKVYQCKNPSSARSLAQKLIRSNKFIDYEYSTYISYFDPQREDFSNLNFLNSVTLTYDKTKKCYSYKSETNNKKLDFAVDNKGLRKWEIVYGDNNKPKYINEPKSVVRPN